MLNFIYVVYQLSVKWLNLPEQEQVRFGKGQLLVGPDPCESKQLIWDRPLVESVGKRRCLKGKLNKKTRKT